MMTITGIVKYPAGLPRKEWPIRFFGADDHEAGVPPVDSRKAQIRRAVKAHYHRAADKGLCKMCRVRPGVKGSDVRDKGRICLECKERTRKKRAKKKELQSGGRESKAPATPQDGARDVLLVTRSRVHVLTKG